MSDEKRDVLQAVVPPTTPVEIGEPKVTPLAKAAGGPGALIATARHALREAGVVRSLRTLRQVNQQEGFDCPSCAWPDPGERSIAEFCENGAKAVTDEATRHRVGPDFFRDWSIARLAEQSDQWLNAAGRLTHPMLRRAGASHYEPISWDDAFAVVAEELEALASPHEAVFYTSGRTSNEAAFLYQLFVRQLGTNNLPDCSNMCHESSGVGLHEALGTGKGTVQLEDFALADAIFVFGQNPGTNHPRMLATLREAKQRGCRIVAINPLREPGLLRFRHPQKPGDMLGAGVSLVDLYLQVRVGGDLALLAGIMKAMLEEEARRPGQVLDRPFLAEHTSGFEELEAALAATSWDEIVDGSGVSESELRQAAAIAVTADRTIACWAMGITQHRNGVANVQGIVNFLLLRGNLGRPGAGACPVRGHSNVQGDRTMGIWEYPPAWIDRLGAEFGFAPPREVGFDTVGALQAMHEGRAQVFVGLGGNFLSATPDTEYTARALRNLRLTVQVSTKLNRSHLVTGERALILPCLGRTERDIGPAGPRFVTVEDSMSVVHRSEGVLAPASTELRSEPEIVAGLAHATLGARSSVDWRALAADYDAIRDAIARVVPGFENFNERVRTPSGFILPNAAHARQFATTTGKARFCVAPLPRRELAPGQLLLTTIRSHDQFNTTVYGLDDRYRGIYGHRRVVFVGAEELAERGLRAGQRVTLTSHFQGETRTAPDFVAVAYDIPRGCAAAYFPEANVLVPVGDFAERSRTPASKAVVITIEATKQ